MLYIAPFTFDWTVRRIIVDPGVVDVTVLDLWTAIKLARATEEGIAYDRIATADGRNVLGPGVQTGLTLELLDPWQIKFPDGNYIARVSGGNLIGGPGGDPVAYSAGVQTLLIQSAASTLVIGSSAPQVSVGILHVIGDTILVTEESSDTIVNDYDTVLTIEDVVNSITVEDDTVLITDNDATASVEPDSTIGD